MPLDPQVQVLLEQMMDAILDKSKLAMVESVQALQSAFNTR